MYISEDEILHIINILIYVARADGYVDQWEYKELETALKKIDFYQKINLENLLRKSFNLSQELEEIVSIEAQDFLVESLQRLIHANGNFDFQEEKAFREILTYFEYHPERIEKIIKIALINSRVKKLFRYAPIEDPELRKKKIKSRVLKYSITAAILGAFPIPIFSVSTEALIIGCQILLISDIADMWGYNQIEAKTLLEIFVSSLGMGASHILIYNITKFIPGLGSIIGICGWFASTYTIGIATNEYFINDRQITYKKKINNKRYRRKKIY